MLGALKRGGWRVVHFDAEASQLMRTEQPGANQLISSDVCELEFSTEWTLPSWRPLTSPYENHEHALNELLKQLNGDSGVHRLCTSPRRLLIHRLFGQPDLLHDDMKVDCELAASGFSCDYREPEALTLRASAHERAKDWRLLLQLDTDDAPGWVFGENGRIYYYVRDADLRRQDFNGCWLGLQCY